MLVGCSGEVIMEGSITPDECHNTDAGAGTRVDNRYLVQVVLGRHPCRVLFDPGATISVMGLKVAEGFKERLKDANSTLEVATSQISLILTKEPAH